MHLLHGTSLRFRVMSRRVFRVAKKTHFSKLITALPLYPAAPRFFDPTLAFLSPFRVAIKNFHPASRSRCVLYFCPAIHEERMSAKTDANCAFYKSNNIFIRDRHFNCNATRSSAKTELKNLVFAKLVYSVTNEFRFTRGRYYLRVENVQSEASNNFNEQKLSRLSYS